MASVNTKEWHKYDNSAVIKNGYCIQTCHLNLLAQMHSTFVKVL